MFYAIKTRTGWAVLQGGDSFDLDPRHCLTPDRGRAERVAYECGGQVVPVSLELGEPYTPHLEPILPELHLSI